MMKTTPEMKSFRNALSTMTETEGEALWHAVAQFVSNCQDAVENGDAEDQHLKAAESAMEKLDAVMAAKAKTCQFPATPGTANKNREIWK